jgi:hypothetical protein
VRKWYIIVLRTRLLHIAAARIEGTVLATAYDIGDAQPFVLVVSGFTFIAMFFTGYHFTLMHYVTAAVLAATSILHLSYSRSDDMPMKKRVALCIGAMNAAGWCTCVAAIWWQYWRGTLRRLRADEGDRMIVCACFWVVAMSAPHVLQAASWLRLMLYCHAGGVAFTSPNWRYHLLFAMATGEAVGQTMGRIVQTIEQLRREKERLCAEQQRALNAEQQRLSESQSLLDAALAEEASLVEQNESMLAKMPSLVEQNESMLAEKASLVEQNESVQALVIYESFIKARSMWSRERRQTRGPPPCMASQAPDKKTEE